VSLWSVTLSCHFWLSLWCHFECHFRVSLWVVSLVPLWCHLWVSLWRVTSLKTSGHFGVSLAYAWIDWRVTLVSQRVTLAATLVSLWCHPEWHKCHFSVTLEWHKGHSESWKVRSRCFWECPKVSLQSDTFVTSSDPKTQMLLYWRMHLIWQYISTVYHHQPVAHHRDGVIDFASVCAWFSKVKTHPFDDHASTRKVRGLVEKSVDCQEILLACSFLDRDITRLKINYG
jgi:hypothetical protein